MYVLVVRSSVDHFALDFEGEGGVGWDVGAGAVLAVGHVGRDGQLALAPDLHALDAHVPPLDDLALAQLELEGLALKTSVKLLARLGEGALVIHAHVLAGLGFRTVAYPNVFCNDAPFEGLLLRLAQVFLKGFLSFV